MSDTTGPNDTPARWSTWLPAVVVALAWIVSALAWSRLPERMPVHWGLDGTPNGWGSRVEGTLLMPAMMLFLWLVLRALPKIDPRRANYAKFAGSYDIMVCAVLVSMLLIHAGALGVALGLPLDIGRLASAVIGMLFVVMGNVMPRARPNWWFGIRTPWTLSNDRVWARTHRVGGYLFVIGGLAFLAAAAVGGRAVFVGAFVVCMIVSLASVVYSYVAWRQETSR